MQIEKFKQIAKKNEKKKIFKKLISDFYAGHLCQKNAVTKWYQLVI